MIASNRCDPEVERLKASIKELLSEKLSCVTRHTHYSFFTDEVEYTATYSHHANAIDNAERLNHLLLNNDKACVVVALAEIMLGREGKKYKSRLHKRISDYAAELILDEAIAAMPSVKIDRIHGFFVNLHDEKLSTKTSSAFAQINQIYQNLINAKKNLEHGVLKRLVDTVDNTKKQNILQYAIDALYVLLLHDINRKSVFLTLQRLDKALDLNMHLVSQSIFKSSAGGTSAAIRIAYTDLCKIYSNLPPIPTLQQN